MNKHLNRLMISYCAIAAIFSVSCGNRDKHHSAIPPEVNLIHNSSTFSAPITCVSVSDSTGILFIGLDNGYVVKKDLHRNKQESIPVGKNRIYDILKYADKLLIGVRDEGLKIYDISTNTLDSIPFLEGRDHKLKRYAAYSIALEKHANIFLLGTSDGPYTLAVDQAIDPGCKEKRLVPFSETLQLPNYACYKVLCSHNNTYIACGNTLLHYNNDTEAYRLLFDGAINDLFASGDDLLYVCLRDGDVYRVDATDPKNPTQGKLDFRGQFHNFAIDDLGGEWYISKYNIAYKQNAGENVVLHAIPQGVSLQGRSIVGIDGDYVLVACQNQLQYFALHQNIAGKSNNIVALCKHPDKREYLCLAEDGCLHSIIETERENGYVSKPLGYIKDLPLTTDIIGSCVTNDAQYWIATERNIYVIDISRRAVANSIKIDKPSNDIKCMYYDQENDRIYIGTRNGLLYIDCEETVPALRPTKLKDSQKYITAICEGRFQGDREKSLFVATLNTGLYKVAKDPANEKDSVQLIGADKYGNMYNVGMNDYLLRLHTSHGLFEYDNTTGQLNAVKDMQLPMSDVKSTKLGKDDCYLIGYQGLAKVTKGGVVKELSYRDVAFNSTTCIADNNMLIGGSQSGLMTYRDGELEQIILSTPKEPVWEQFFRTYLLSILGLIGCGAVVFLLLKRTNRRVTELESRYAKYEKTPKENRNASFPGITDRDLMHIKYLVEGLNGDEIAGKFKTSRQQIDQRQEQIGKLLGIPYNKVNLLVAKAIKEGLYNETWSEL